MGQCDLDPVEFRFVVVVETFAERTTVGATVRLIVVILYIREGYKGI
jgi:hypothetical protein